MARILGIDPGSQRTGFGIVDTAGPRMSYVASGVIRAGAGDFGQRLHEIYRCVRDLVQQYRPTQLAIERVFVNRNVDSALKLGQARGAAICALADVEVEMFEYAPRQIKLAVVGSGSAEKTQVQLMIKVLLKLEGRISADAADALAAAMCHAMRGGSGGTSRAAGVAAHVAVIGFLKGRLAVKQPPALMVDVNGVGYELEAPMSTFYTLPAAGEAVSLFTHLVVREDAHVLYGFGSDRERRLFRALLKISGVGPKMALGILSGASVDDFLVTVEAEDIDMLTRIPGIGRKTAERVIIEMRGGVRKIFGTASGAAVAGMAVAGGAGLTASSSPKTEAFSALVTLGYKPAEVTRLMMTLDEAGLTTEEIIRLALKAVAKVQAPR